MNLKTIALIFFLIYFLVSCSNPTQDTHPSLVIREGTTYSFFDNETKIFHIAPSGIKGGKIELMLVHNGNVETLQEIRFRDLLKNESIALQISKDGLDLALSGTAVKNSQRSTIQFPKDMKVVTQGNISGERILPRSSNRVDVWTLTGMIGEMKSDGVLKNGNIDLLTKSSLENKNMFYYLLLLTPEE